MTSIKQTLQYLTNFPHIYLKSRGNAAIRDILQILSDNGIKEVLLQDQGGWLRYRDYAPKYGLKVTELKTDHGVIIPSEIPGTPDSALIYQSLAGYFAKQPMKAIRDAFKGPIIADITGDIGTIDSFPADYLICSLGKEKPVNLGYGGFIASKVELDIDEDFDTGYKQELVRCLENLPKRVTNLHEKAKKVKSDLSGFQIVHKDAEGVNVIVRFDTDDEKDSIIQYCDKNSLEYTLCPRYIRVNDTAVSIELKRLTF